MDSASTGGHERLLKLAGENEILSVGLPVHTINILQHPDLLSFGPLKKLSEPAPGEFGDDLIDEQILKPLHVEEQSAAPMAIIGA
jgi:hypothetical protein